VSIEICLPKLVLWGLSAASGLLLFASDHPLHCWPLQIVALVPWLVGMAAFGRSWGRARGAGFCLGFFYTAPLLIALEFPILLGATLGIYQTLLWMGISVGLRWILRWPPVWAALGASAMVVAVEWVDVSLLPVFGTAQCFARVWSAWPGAIQVTALVGMLGLIFLLVFPQALVARLLAGDRRRSFGKAAIAFCVFLAVVVGANLGLWFGAPEGELRVAAVGWTHQWPAGAAENARATLDRRVIPNVSAAADMGARLVVTPEVGLRVDSSDRQATRETLAGLAREHGIWLATGVWDGPSETNRLLVFDPQGSLRAEYLKTHLIYSLEDYTAGPGEVPAIELGGSILPGAILSGMICQDDNFTDLSRMAGRAGARITAVPTNDWNQVREYHLENSLFRAVESRYGIVRAATNGVSAIATARGEVLARRDHFETGSGFIVADLPIYRRVSRYNHLGDWPVLGVSLLLLGLGIWLQCRRGTQAE
jgi:apolipoprotein N-acyltransferase